MNRFGSFGNAGQATGAARAPVHLPEGRRPQLDIAWGSFHQGISSSLGVLLRKSPVPEKFTIEGFFKYCWIEGQLPRRAILAAALWHVVFFVLPYPQLPSRAHPNPAFDNVELSWSGPVNDLPLLELKAAKPQPEPKPTPQSEPEKPPPREGADAFHPRQHIFSDPVRPNHPRQTLINSAAPPEPPKILPNLPNMVQIQDLAGPARPRLVISKEELAKLHPKQRRLATVTDAPPPDVPMFEQKPGELALMASPNAPARPSLELNAGASPRIAPKAQPGDSGPAPEVGAAELAGANGNPATLIALSARLPWSECATPVMYGGKCARSTPSLRWNCRPVRRQRPLRLPQLYRRKEILRRAYPSRRKARNPECRAARRRELPGPPAGPAAAPATMRPTLMGSTSASVAGILRQTKRFRALPTRPRSTPPRRMRSSRGLGQKPPPTTSR